MRDNLDGLSKICALALLADDGVVDFSCSDVVRLGGVDPEESLVVSQVKVGLGTVFSDITLAVLVWVERTRINIDIRVEFLDGYLQTPCLKKLCERCGNDALSERGCDTACDENVLCVHK